MALRTYPVARHGRIQVRRGLPLRDARAARIAWKYGLARVSVGNQGSWCCTEHVTEEASQVSLPQSRGHRSSMTTVQK